MTEDEDALIPVIRLWDLLLVVLQGDVSDSQADAMAHSILERIQTYGTRALVIDASGLLLVDSHMCALLADIARAARLMGARTILSGVDPRVAQTLMQMGIELRGIECVMSLEQAFHRLGIRRDDRGGDAAGFLTRVLADLDDRGTEVG